jgi:Zn-dependent alcohol dehydrogenase
VRKVVPGDHVVLAPDSDGTCEQCASGEPTYCERFLELNFQTGTDGRTARLADGRRAPPSSTSVSRRSRTTRSPGSAAWSRFVRTFPSRCWGRSGAAFKRGLAPS